MIAPASSDSSSKFIKILQNSDMALIFSLVGYFWRKRGSQAEEVAEKRQKHISR
jgi:hypothetical protein